MMIKKTLGHLWLKIEGQIRHIWKLLCTEYGWIEKRIVNFIKDSMIGLECSRDHSVAVVDLL